MSWMTEFADPAAVRERTLKSFAVPIGLANPLWLAFGAAASAGAAWWLMTRWASPSNVEAMFGAAKTPAKKVPATTPVAVAVALEVAPAIVEAVVAPIEVVLETAKAETAAIAEAVSEAPAAPETEAGIEAEIEAMADDLTRLVGVGPRTAAALAERGIASFAQLAAWTEDEMAAFDAEMNLKGRSLRDAWRAQAKRLAAEA